MKKTRKQKIEAQKHRENYLYSLENLKLKSVVEKPDESFVKKEKKEPPKGNLLEGQNYSYLKKDLLKILVFCIFALTLEIVLHLTLF